MDDAGEASRPAGALDALVRLFYDARAALGDFRRVEAEAVPEPARSLLDHDAHMTVTLEAHHGGPVELRVLESWSSGAHLARRILLVRRSDGAVVQFGIVRLRLAGLDPAVRRDVERAASPLGRVLIEHDVLREVQRLALWAIAPGPELRRHLGVAAGGRCFGRTARILCDGAPAIDLLEIVPAGSTPPRTEAP